MINDSSNGKFIFVTVLVPTTFGLSLMLARSSNYVVSWGLIVVSLVTLIMSLTLMFRFFLNLKLYKKKNLKKGDRLFSWLIIPLLGVLLSGAPITAISNSFHIASESRLLRQDFIHVSRSRPILTKDDLIRVKYISLGKFGLNIN